jgi:hypothetical protein
MLEQLEILKTKTIPSIKEDKKTFLEIARMPHYEDVITRLYAWYLDETAGHGTGSWLKDTLTALIRSKTSTEFYLDHYSIKTQHVISTQEKIDLVITAYGSDQQEYIIVENKIYHHLDNNLLNYWNEVGTDQDKKIGILLTLTAHAIPDSVAGRFINITHKEIARNLKAGYDGSTLSDRQKVYAEDFLLTLEKLTKTHNMNEAVAFYFANTQLVSKAIETKEQALNYILSEIEHAGIKLDLGFSELRNDWDFRYLSEPDNGTLYYTIFYDQLLAGKKIVYVVLEVNQEGMKKFPPIDQLMEQFKFSGLIVKPEVKAGYIHLLAKSYALNDEQISKLGTTLAELIERDFESHRKELKKAMLA